MRYDEEGYPITGSDRSIGDVQHKIWTIINLHRRDVERKHGGRTVGKTFNDEEACIRIEQLVNDARYDELEKVRWILQRHNPNNTLAGVYMELNQRSIELAAGAVQTRPSKPKPQREKKP